MVSLNRKPFYNAHVSKMKPCMRSGKTGMSKVVMVIDDEPSNRELVEAFLKRAGYAPHGMFSGEDALAALFGGEVSPALVVTDARLGIPDGFEVCERIRNNPATTALPVIIISASKLPEDYRRAKDVGADVYYYKPDGWQGLITHVRTLIG
jgi:CheY-like chemotaxis protein